MLGFGVITGLLGEVAELVLPRACLACEAFEVPKGQLLCADCSLKLLSLVSIPYCVRCGTSLGADVKPSAEGCYACPNPLPRFVSVVRLGAYSNPIRQVIRGLKYRRQDAMLRSLGKMLGRAVEAHLAITGQCIEKPDVVVPVPMYWRRRISRGCDHAAVLAKALARELGVPFGQELTRIRNTPPQAHLPRTRRLVNVKGAFRAKAAAVAGASILLVDDVTTTGATASEAARTLLDAGAQRVVLAVLAKADPPMKRSGGEA